MKLKARCGKCNLIMTRSKMPGVTVWTCPRCSRVAVVAGTVNVGDAFETRMKALGYHRAL